MPAEPARILVVDDNEMNRDLLGRRLKHDGHAVSLARNGAEALDAMRRDPFDLVLLDIMMPGMDGFQVLETMKADPALSDLPVIVISALDDLPSTVRCIEMGAEDYLHKPFDPVLLRARIGATLEKKRLRDREREALRIGEEQRAISDSLLLNILPATIAKELRSRGSVQPRYYEDVTIAFTDFAAFAPLAESLSPVELVALLDDCFSEFDEIVARHSLEKLKTIGDSYMFVGGLPDRSETHPVDAIRAGLEMLRVVQDRNLAMRIGMHTGPVVGGVVGKRKFAFDIWGAAVNFASRLESSGEPGQINISAELYIRVRDFFDCVPRGQVATKDGRHCEMYFVRGARSPGAAPPPG